MKKMSFAKAEKAVPKRDGLSINKRSGILAVILALIMIMPVMPGWVPAANALEAAGAESAAAETVQAPEEMPATVSNNAALTEDVPAEDVAGEDWIRRINVYEPGHFPDVPESAWYAKNVEAAYETGLLLGFEDGSFRPEENITIAQVITIAARIYSKYMDDGEKFSRSKGQKWYEPYMRYAEDKGIIARNEFGNVNAPSTRRSVSTILACSLPEDQFPVINDIKEGELYDVALGTYFTARVYRLYRAGILVGRDPCGRFDAEYWTTRAEVSALINRIVFKYDRLHFKPQQPDPETLAVYRIVSKMSTQQKIDQLFVLTPEGLTGSSSQLTTAGSSVKTALKNHPVGGILFFAANLKTPSQTKTMLANYTAYSKEIEGVPLFLSVDEEGGRVARIANNSAFGVRNPGPMKQIRDADAAYSAGSYMGSYLKNLGFNMDLAPVADVITVSGNKDIGDRSFGTDPARVSSLAAALSRGLQSQGILSTYKHFPGNGATAADTHEGFAYTDKSLADLMKAELVPFRAAQSNGVDAVMIAHISVPGVTGDRTPSSLSKTMITDVLRGQLGYTGLVITDSLSMGAIVKHYGTADAAARAVEAGADLLLKPQDFQTARKGVADAVSCGDITIERLDQSMNRIVRAKLRMNG